MENGYLKAVELYRNGELTGELDEELRIVMEAVESLRKPGSITLTINVAPPSATGEVFTFTAGVKSSIPKPPRRGQSFYMGEDGLPQPNHPKQDDMFNAPNVTSIKREEANHGN